MSEQQLVAFLNLSTGDKNLHQKWSNIVSEKSKITCSEI